MPIGSLSLPARLCLLAWGTAETEVGGAGLLPPLVRSGALVELARRGLLVDEDGVATPADLDTETGDAVLDGLLELVRESRPHGWRTWVALRARITLDAVRVQLAAEGCLRAEKRRVFGVFPTVDYALDRVAVADALREESRAVLLGSVPVAELSERDAALAVLMDAAGSAAGHGCQAGQARVEELIERCGASAAVLRTVAREVPTATTVDAAVGD